MFMGYESALKTHLAGVVPGAPIYGTFDEPDFEQDPMHVQIVWLGYQLDSQTIGRTEASIQQLFAIRIGIGSARGDDTQAAKASNALAAVLKSALGFVYRGLHGARIKPQLTSPPPPAYAGAAAELAVYFTLQGVAVAAPDQEQ